MSTLTTLTAAVYAHLGVPSTDGQFTAALVTAYINEALAEIATEHDWPWLEDFETLTTTAGVGFVVPGTSVVYAGTDNVSVTVGTEITPLEMRTYDELINGWSAVTRGVPAVWAIKFEKIHLRPIPDSTYDMIHAFVKGEKTLSAGSDTPFMPDNYAPAIVNLATAIALGRSKEDVRAISAQARYDRWAARMLDNRRRNRRPGRIRVRPGGWL